ncbi:MAG: hypothetical protein WDA60_16520 [Acidimicrobiia bacterium]
MAVQHRGFVAAALVAMIAMTTAASAGASPARRPLAAAAQWKVGDCFTDANVDVDEVTLSSAVPCTKDHTVQIVGGAELPAALASAPLTTLTDTKSAVRPQLAAFAKQTCSASAVVENLYPKQAKALAALFEKNGVTDDWMVPAAGRMGWVLPEAASFDAGAKALLCVFEPDADIGSGRTAGDIRKISTRDPLATLRLCFDFNAENTGQDFQPCDKVHDGERLIFFPMSVSGKPADVTAWQDADWAPYDAVCAEFAAVLVGAKRADFKVRADTNAPDPIVDGTRFFNCQTYPTKKTAAIPAGVIMTGAGKAKIKFAKT